MLVQPESWFELGNPNRQTICIDLAYRLPGGSYPIFTSGDEEMRQFAADHRPELRGVVSRVTAARGAGVLVRPWLPGFWRPMAIAPAVRSGAWLTRPVKFVRRPGCRAARDRRGRAADCREAGAVPCRRGIDLSSSSALDPRSCFIPGFGHMTGERLSMQLDV